MRLSDTLTHTTSTCQSICGSSQRFICLSLFFPARVSVLSRHENQLGYVR